MTPGTGIMAPGAKVKTPGTEVKTPGIMTKVSGKGIKVSVTEVKGTGTEVEAVAIKEGATGPHFQVQKQLLNLGKLEEYLKTKESCLLSKPQRIIFFTSTERHNLWNISMVMIKAGNA